MADTEHPAGPPIELPNYRFKELLDRGGMGAVYLAEQINPQREVAIKVITPEDLPRASPEVLDSVLEMLQHEGNIAARFNHENLITVHECGVVGDHYYLAMEYLPGGSLRERLGTGLDPEEACAIVVGIARGLAEMHSDGVLHRDIKPENILFRKNGRPVLMDYGVAKDAGTISKLTQWGLSTGTPEYMSPEQVDDRPVDTRSDLYALGVLLYELLTGEVPFTGSSAMAVGYAHVHQPVPRLPKSLERYQHLIDRLLAKDPDDRFQSAEEVIAALDPARVETGSPTRVTPVGTGRLRVTMMGELKRRKVLHTAGVYGVTAFGITEILQFIIDNFGLPTWTSQLMAALFVAGFPIAMLLSWVFDIEPGGRLRRTRFQGQSTKPIVAGAVALLIGSTWGLYLLIQPDPGVVPTVEQTADVPTPVEPAPQETTEVPRNSIAVLPFADLSAAQDQAFLGEGMADTLISVLAQVSALQVTARNSSFTFRSRETSAGEIAAKLGVVHVLEGSVQRAGDRIRINAQLIDASTEVNVWTEVFDAGTDEIFAVQDRIAEAVIEAMQVQLLDSEQIRLRERYQPRPGAYEQLILGRQELNQRTTEGLYAAERHLEAALELDPDYALPYVELALAHYLLPFYDGARSMDEDHAYGRSLIDKALELDPQSGEAYAIRTRFETDPLVREQDFLKAIELSPNYPTAHYYYGLLLMDELGRPEEGAEHLLRAAELDPMAPNLQWTAVQGLIRAGRIEEGLALSDENIARQPDVPQHLNAAVSALFDAGRVDEALARGRHYIETQPEATALIGLMAELYLRLGRFAEAKRFWDEEYRLDPSDPEIQLQRCLASIQLGDFEGAGRCALELEAAHPGSSQAIIFPGALHHARDEPVAAIERLQSVMDRLPGISIPLLALVNLLAGEGQPDSALALMDEHCGERCSQFLAPDRQLGPNDLDEALTLAMILHADGDFEQRDRLIARIERLLATGSDFDYIYKASSPVYLAAMKGDRSGAIRALREAVDSGWRAGWWWLTNSWLLKQTGLLNDSEFVAMLDELKAIIEEERRWYEAHKDDPLT